jgi:hypothetical protein
MAVRARLAKKLDSVIPGPAWECGYLHCHLQSDVEYPPVWCGRCWTVTFCDKVTH